MEEKEKRDELTFLRDERRRIQGRLKELGFPDAALEMSKTRGNYRVSAARQATLYLLTISAKEHGLGYTEVATVANCTYTHVRYCCNTAKDAVDGGSDIYLREIIQSLRRDGGDAWRG